MRGRRCYRWDLRRSRASACGEKVEIDACRREGGTCVLCHEDKKMKAKELSEVDLGKIERQETDEDEYDDQE